MQYNDNIPQLFLNDFHLSNYIKYSDRVYIHREVDINTPVYHYMDYIYLIEMLEKKSFYISNRTKFQDQREYGAKENKRYSFSAFLDANMSKPKAVCCVKRHNEKKNLAYNDTAISCWTYDSHGNYDESYILWNWFGKEKCRIESNIKNIIDNLTDCSYDIIICKVEYAKEKFDTTIQDQIFRKHYKYKDEQEIRVCILNCNHDIVIPIRNMDVFLHKVRLSPFTTEKNNEFLDILKKFDWLKGKIEKTKIFE